MDISSNYIPKKYIVIDDKYPPWMAKAIKESICKNLYVSKKNSLDYII